MYEILALCICTSCLSCICCFVTGALCAIPKLLQIRKDLDVDEIKRNNDAEGIQIGGNSAIIDDKRECYGTDNFVKKVICKCPKKIVIHTLPIADEDAMCGLRKRDGCSCAPLHIDRNLDWK